LLLQALCFVGLSFADVVLTAERNRLVRFFLAAQRTVFIKAVLEYGTGSADGVYAG